MENPTLTYKKNPEMIRQWPYSGHALWYYMYLPEASRGLISHPQAQLSQNHMPIQLKTHWFPLKMCIAAVTLTDVKLIWLMLLGRSSIDASTLMIKIFQIHLGINIKSPPQMVTDLWTFNRPIGYNGKIQNPDLWPLDVKFSEKSSIPISKCLKLLRAV